jgi:hypothetical protein
MDTTAFMEPYDLVAKSPGDAQGGANGGRQISPRVEKNIVTTTTTIQNNTGGVASGGVAISGRWPWQSRSHPSGDEGEIYASVAVGLGGRHAAPSNVPASAPERRVLFRDEEAKGKDEDNNEKEGEGGGEGEEEEEEEEIMGTQAAPTSMDEEEYRDVEDGSREEAGLSPAASSPAVDAVSPSLSPATRTAAAVAAAVAATITASTASRLSINHDTRLQDAKSDLADVVRQKTGKELQGEWTITWKAGSGRDVELGRQRKCYTSPSGKDFSRQIDVVQYVSMQPFVLEDAGAASPAPANDSPIATAAAIAPTPGASAAAVSAAPAATAATAAAKAASTVAAATPSGSGTTRPEAAIRDLADAVLQETGLQLDGDWTITWERVSGGRDSAGKKRKRFHAPDGKTFSRQIDAVNHLKQQQVATGPTAAASSPAAVAAPYLPATTIHAAAAAAAAASSSSAASPPISNDDDRAEGARRDLAEFVFRETGTRRDLAAWSVEWEPLSTGGKHKRRKVYYTPDRRRYDRPSMVVNHFEQLKSQAGAGKQPSMVATPTLAAGVAAARAARAATAAAAATVAAAAAAVGGGAASVQQRPQQQVERTHTLIHPSR